MMNIEKISHYNISTTNEEDKTIQEMLTILYEIRDEMTRKGCDILQWEDSGSQVDKADIDEMIDCLDTLQYVNIMF